MMEKFFVTLTSDSPCEFNQENTCSKFRVHLGRVLELVGKYEVALCEMFYPATLCNIRKSECFATKNSVALLKPNESGGFECTFTNEKTGLKCDAVINVGDDFHNHTQKQSLNSGYYHTAEEFLDDFNYKMAKWFKCEFDIKTQKTKIFCLSIENASEITSSTSLTLSPTLESILGFSHGTLFKPGYHYSSEIKCDLRKGIPSMLYVCSDLIGEQIINNSHDKILRSFHIAPEKFVYGFQKKETFLKLFFLPVAKKKIEFVDIYIKENMQNEASFTHGTLKVVLLFRRVGND